MKTENNAEALSSAVPLDCRVRLRNYLEAIKPYQKIRYDIYCVVLPSIKIYPDGRMEQEYNFTDGQKRALQLADDAMEAIKHQMGMVPNVELRYRLACQA